MGTRLNSIGFLMVFLMCGLKKNKNSMNPLMAMNAEDNLIFSAISFPRFLFFDVKFLEVFFSSRTRYHPRDLDESKRGSFRLLMTILMVCH